MMDDFRMCVMGEMIKERKKYFEQVTTMCIILAIACVIFEKYIFEGYQFLTLNNNMCSDLIRANYPTYMHLYDLLFEKWSWWSWEMGIGTTMVSHIDCVFDPFTYICFIGGRNNIGYFMVWSMIVKLMFEGFTFSLYVKQFVTNSFSIIISSVMYAYCGYSMIMGTNLALGTVLVYFPLILLGIEKLLKYEKTSTSMVLGLIGVACLSLYFYFEVGILSLLYLIVRGVAEKKLKLNQIVKLGIVGIICFMLASFTLLPQISTLITNARINEGKDILFSLNLFIPNAKSVYSLFLRMLGLNLLGNNIQTPYSGVNVFGGIDYFQNECYTTCLCLPLIMLLIWNKRKSYKKYVWYLIFFLCAISVPFFSYMLNAFSTINERWIFIFHCLICVLIAISIDDVVVNKHINIYGLLLSFAVVKFVIRLSLRRLVGNGGADIVFNENKGSYIAIIIVYLLFLLLCIFYNKYKDRKGVIVVLAICCFILFTYETVQNYKFWFINDNNLYVEQNENSYTDSSLKVINQLNEQDDTWYRIYKDFDSVYDSAGIPSDNDAMVQKYYGVKCYNSQNNSSYIDFLQKMGIYVGCLVNYREMRANNIMPEQLTGAGLNYINGVDDKYELLSYLGVKYYLKKKDQDIDIEKYGFKYLYSYEDIEVYQNMQFNDLIICNDNTMIEKEFDKLNYEQRMNVLLNTTIAEETDDCLVSDASVAMQSFEDDRVNFEVDVKNEQSNIAFLIPYDEGWTAYVDGRKSDLKKYNIGFLGLKVSHGKHTIELAFFPRMLREGIVVSCTTLVCLVLVFTIRKLMYHRKNIYWESK